ncbi:hypothetical protein MC885_012397 [Smutsia gigantea]|nr:hypothetical protein MC885_012397 [Smutsia gigantea]
MLAPSMFPFSGRPPRTPPILFIRCSWRVLLSPMAVFTWLLVLICHEGIQF